MFIHSSWHFQNIVHLLGSSYYWMWTDGSFFFFYSLMFSSSTFYSSICSLGSWISTFSKASASSNDGRPYSSKPFTCDARSIKLLSSGSHRLSPVVLLFWLLSRIFFSFKGFFSGGSAFQSPFIYSRVLLAVVWPFPLIFWSPTDTQKQKKLSFRFDSVVFLWSWLTK